MSKLETNTIDNISGSSTLTIGDTNATAVTIDSGVSTVTIPNGAATGHMYPAFEAYLSANQTGLSSGVFTKVQVDTERFDTDGYYDNSTNYRFTPLVAGKYFVYAQVGCRSNNDVMDSNQVDIYKNGSLYARNYNFNGSNSGDRQRNARLITLVVDMNGSTDYLELFTSIAVDSGTLQVEGGTVSGQETFFGAYRIGA